MYIRPSVDDLLDGVRRNLDQLLIPLLESLPDAQKIALPILTTLDRVANEWRDRWPHLTGDAVAIGELLTEVRVAVAGSPFEAGVREAAAGLPAVHTDGDVHRAAEVLERHKAALVEVIEVLDLPAGPDAPDVVRAADALVLQGLIAYAERELAAVPAIDLADVAARNNTVMANQPVGDLPSRLAAYLELELGAAGDYTAGSIQVVDFETMPGGNSRDTYLFDLAWNDASGAGVKESCVMQREALSSLLDTDSAEGVVDGTRRRPETEFKVVRAMAEAGINVPPMLWCDPTGDHLDRPFVIGRRLPGTTSDVALRAGDPEVLAAVFDDYVRTVAKLHEVDHQALGLQFLGHDTTVENAARQQVELFESAFRRNALEAHPGVEYLIRWLHRNAPTAAEVSVIHGDFRRGNFLHDGGRVTAYIDWEQVHLGDPLEEIAFMYWSFWTLRSVMSMDEFLSRYEEVRGITVDRDALAFWRMFQELKMLVVGLTGLHSYFASETRQIQYSNPYNQTFTTDCYLRTLRELAAGGPSYLFPAADDAPVIY